MDFLAEIFSTHKSLHHAYILEGERGVVREKLLNFLNDDFGFSVQGNPDFSHEQYETFSIDDARKLRDMQAMKAVAGNRRVYIIETLAMTVEAQNSLLKVFEEPNPGSHFFIITPTSEIFLPTLKSRVIILRNAEENFRREKAEIFLKLDVKKRLELVGEITEEKNKNEAIDLITQLIFVLHDKVDTFVMGELLKTREYLSDRSSSLKILLEHIALIVPKKG